MMIGQAPINKNDVLVEFNKEIVNALKDQSCETRRITSKEYNITEIIYLTQVC